MRPYQIIESFRDGNPASPHSCGLTRLRASGGLAALSVAVTAALAISVPAFATTTSTATWTNAGGDNNWANAANWSYTVVPNPLTAPENGSGGISDYNVFLGLPSPTNFTGSTVTLDSLTINSGGILDTSSSTSSAGFDLVGTGGFSNSGTVNVTGSLRLQAASLQGGGTIALESGPASLTLQLPFTGSISPTTSISSSNTITGSGTITVYGGGLTGFINSGTVNADTANGTLNVASPANISNQGVMEATNNGTLSFGNTILTQTAAGELYAHGGNVVASSIDGGTISTDMDGIVTASSLSGSATNPLNISSASTIKMTSGTSYLSGDIVNNGTINLGGAAGIYSQISLNGDTAIGGTGSVVLGGGTLNLEQGVSTGGSYNFTLGASQTLSGTGAISVYSPSVTLTNDGTVNANVAGGTLAVGASYSNSPITNNGTMEAANGGTLQLENVAQSATGVIDAASGNVKVEFVSGGMLESGTGYAINLVSPFSGPSPGGGISGTSANPLTITSGSSVVVAASEFSSDNVAVAGSIVNNGTIQIEGPPPPNGLPIAALSLIADTNISGTGSIVLANNGGITSTQDTNPGQVYTLTIGSQQTISGNGFLGATLPSSINYAFNIVNNGTINANSAAGGMSVGGANDFSTLPALTNNGVLEATNGGTLYLESFFNNPAMAMVATINQSASGAIYAHGGTVSIGSNAISVEYGVAAGPIISGGILKSDPGSEIQSFDTFTLSGSVSTPTTITSGSVVDAPIKEAGSGSSAINVATAIGLAGTVTNNGTIDIGDNPSGITAPTAPYAPTHCELFFDSGSSSDLIGSGSVVLFKQGELVGFAPASGTTTSVVDNRLSNGGIVLANGTGRTLELQAGNTNNGTYEAENGGIVQVDSGTLTNYSSGTLTGGAYDAASGGNIDLVGARITTNAASVALDGATSTFAAVAPITLNRGSFTLTNGAAFTTVGDFSNTGTVAVMNGASFVASGTLINQGTISLSGNLAVNADMVVGEINVNPASVYILPGGALTSIDGSIAAGGGIASSQVTVAGAGAQWTLSGDLNVGVDAVAHGTLNIEGGAKVAVGNNMVLGGTSAMLTYGDVTVDGTASNGTPSEVSVGGDLLVSPVGTLSITNGGVVGDTQGAVDGPGYSGYSTTGGRVVVDGIGSTWNNRQFLHIGSGFGIGSLTISGGGVVNAGNSGTAIGIDRLLPTDSSVIVTGNGSKLNSSSGITLGQGSLVIDSGGVVEGGAVSIGSGDGQGTILVGNGGKLIASQMTVAAGSSLVENGGNISTHTAVVASGGTLTGTGTNAGITEIQGGGTLAPDNGNLSFSSGLTLDAGSVLADTLSSGMGEIAVTGGKLTVNGIVNLLLSAGAGFAINTPYTLLSLQTGSSSGYASLNPADFLVSPGSSIQGLVSVSGGNLLFTPGNNIAPGTGWSSTTGAFNDGKNWFSGSPPTSSQPAVFQGSGAANPTPITATFTANESNTKLVDDDANVTLSLAGNAYSLTSTASTGSLVVGGEQGLGAALSASGGALRSVNAVISPYPTGSGKVNLMNLNSASWSNSGNISVGGVGSGQLKIDQNSAVQTNTMNIANRAGSHGEVDNAGKIYVAAALTVNSGGTLNQTGGSATAGSIQNAGNINLSGGTLGGSLTNNSGGTIAMQQGTTITLSGDVVNNGTIDVGAGTAVVSGTTTLDGGGTLQLGGANVSPGQIIGTGAGASVDQLTNYSTIEGAGTIGDPTDTKPFAFTNNGTLDANVNGQVLNVYGSVTGTATGQAYASNGGILYFHSTYNQTGGNTIIGSQPTPSTGSSGGTSPIGNGSGGSTGGGGTGTTQLPSVTATYYGPSQQLPGVLSVQLQNPYSRGALLNGNFLAMTQSQLNQFVFSIANGIGRVSGGQSNVTTAAEIVGGPFNAKKIGLDLIAVGKLFDAVGSAENGVTSTVEAGSGISADITGLINVMSQNPSTNPFEAIAKIDAAEFSGFEQSIQSAELKADSILQMPGVANIGQPLYVIGPGQTLDLIMGGISPNPRPFALPKLQDAFYNVSFGLANPSASSNEGALGPQAVVVADGGVLSPGGKISSAAERALSVPGAATSGKVIFLGYGQNGPGLVTSGGVYQNPGGANISGGSFGGNGSFNGSANVSGNSTVFAGRPNAGGSTVTTGKLVITGNLVINSSYAGTAAQTPVLEFYLGGTTQGGSPGYDYIDVGGNTSLAGDLEVGFTNGFQGAVTASNNFDIITANTTITGSLSNIQSGGRINTIDGFGSFLVSYGAGSSNPNEVVLSDFIPNPGSGLSQSTAIGPTSSANGVYVFNNIPSGAWVDPPSAKGFTYLVATPGGLFTKIDSLPTGFASTMVISVDGYNLGPFAPGDSLDLSSLPGGGATEFTITGINPLGTSTDFPLQVEFNQSNVDFLMSAVPVPEPATLALFALGGLGLVVRKRRGRTLRS